VFLIRDWPNEFEYRWGFNGGGELLDIRMKTTDNDPDGKNLIRDGIKMSFEDIKCFLMPHPGLELTESNNDLRGRHLGLFEIFNLSRKIIF
jgi:atlastin